MVGFRTALSWMTIIPVKAPDDVDRTLGAKTVRAIPLVGVVLGVICRLVSWAFASLAIPWPITGIVITTLLVVLTRGMHVDGLADTIDGLGSYREPEEARQIMRDGRVGPLGLTAVVLALIAETLAFGLLSTHNGHIMIGTVIAVARWATPLMCAAGASHVPRRGFGYLMVGTQRPAFAWVIASIGALLFTGAAAVTSALCGRMPDVSVVVSLLYSAAAVGGTVVYRQHCVRRLGYLTGDVLGANVELLQACGAVAAVCAVATLL